jgi:hypothetical protein
MIRSTAVELCAGSRQRVQGCCRRSGRECRCLFTPCLRMPNGGAFAGQRNSAQFRAAGAPTSRENSTEVGGI